MYPPNGLRRVWLAAAPVAFLLWPAAVSAQVIATNSAASRLQDPQVTFQPGELVGHERVLREFVSFGTNEFMFVVPEGSRPETVKGDFLVVKSRDATFYVSFRIAGPLPAEGDLQQRLKWRVAEQYPDARDMEAFSTTVLNRTGNGFSLKEGRSGVGSRFIKVLWVPSKAGILEFTLNTDAKTVRGAELAFSSMLLTFRSNEHGKLEIVRRSERT